jgi:FixJ family two-component response regulator
MDCGHQALTDYLDGRSRHDTDDSARHAGQCGGVVTKLFAEADLVQTVQIALERDIAAWTLRQQIPSLRERYALLSPWERQIFALIIAGRSNKVAAAELGVSKSTVKIHRRHIMEKLQLRAAADLVRAGERLGVLTSARNGNYTKV